MTGHRVAVTIAAITIAAILLAACRRDGARRHQVPPVRLAASDVAVVQPRTINTGPRISGSLEPRERATVRAQAAGSVTSVSADLGDSVDAGQVLAIIEHDEQTTALRSAGAAVANARTRLKLARRERERTRALVQGGALAQRDLDNARASVEQAEASLEQARTQEVAARTHLADTDVRSPIRGVVSQAGVDTGDVVTVGTALFTIVDPSSMRLRARVSSRNLSSLAPGAPVTFEVRGYPDRTFQGQITSVSPAADPATREVEFLAEIPNRNRELVADLFAEGRLDALEKNVLAIPVTAVDTSGDVATVDRIENGVVNRVSVLLGEHDTRTELVEVEQGLRAGDVVLLRSVRPVTPGTRVQLPPNLGPRSARADGSAPRTRAPNEPR